MKIIFQPEEYAALTGLPFLQQLLYLKAIRPYMDYKTGIVGLKRGVSYQSFAEELYVEPHPGIQSGSPSRDQLRRALQGLERAGLIKLQSRQRKLVIHCCLLMRDKSAQNKAAINPPEDPARVNHAENVIFIEGFNDETRKATTAKPQKPATPLKNNNIYIFIQKAFEQFWEAYPVKRNKQSAWERFESLAPDEALAKTILTALEKQKRVRQKSQEKGIWQPPWKYPANWLRERCWTEVNEEQEEYSHEKRKSARVRQSSSHLLWESCRDGFYAEDNSSTGA